MLQTKVIRYVIIGLYYNVTVLRKNNEHGHLPPTGPSVQSKNKNQIDITDISQKAKVNIFVAFFLKKIIP